MSETRKRHGFAALGVFATCVALVLMLFVTLSPQATPLAPGGMSAQGGVPLSYAGEGTGVGSGGRQVNMSDLPQATLQPSSHPQVRLRPLDGLTDEQYAAKKAAAARLGGHPMTPSAGPAPGSRQGISPEAVGASNAFIAQQEVCCTPPDMALAVSENFVVQFINTYIAVYDKNGNLQAGFPKDADTFFGLAAGTYTTDPRGFYDWANHRFVFVMLTESNVSNPSGSPNVGSIMVAASQTHDPRGGWWVYNTAFTFPTGDCPDYPTLGHDSNDWGTKATKGGFYIGINVFSGANDCGSDGFSTSYIFIFNKDGFYSGGGYYYWYFFGLTDGGILVDTLQPANMTDRSDHPDTIFLVNSHDFTFGDPSNGLDLWSISGPSASPNNPFAFATGGAGPTLTGVFMGTAHDYYFPPNADEPNGVGGVCSGCVDTNDKRISGQVKYHAGELFGSLNTGVSGVTGAHAIWFDVHPVVNNNTSTITGAEERQEDCFFCGGQGTNGSSWFATLQPDQENNLTMVYDYSDDVTYPEVAWTSRRVTYGDSLMNGAGFVLAGGSAFYGQGRWGDYTATAPDLTIANYSRMWFAGQYSNSSGNWGTAIGATVYQSPSSQ